MSFEFLLEVPSAENACLPDR